MFAESSPEADCLLVLDKKYGEYLEFEPKSQTINFVRGKEKQTDLEPYRTGNNRFDHQLYFMKFMEALSSMEVSFLKTYQWIN